MSSSRKFDLIVVNAVRSLQDKGGTTLEYIVKYLKSQYGLHGRTVREKLKMTIKKAVKDGILRWTGK